MSSSSHYIQFLGAIETDQSPVICILDQKWQIGAQNWRKSAQQNRREIVKARLSRREMVRLGLLTAGERWLLNRG